MNQLDAAILNNFNLQTHLTNANSRADRLHNHAVVLTERSKELMMRMLIAESQQQSLLSRLCEIYPSQANKIVQIAQEVSEASENSKEYQQSLRKYVESGYENGIPSMPPKPEIVAVQKKSREHEMTKERIIN